MRSTSEPASGRTSAPRSDVLREADGLRTEIETWRALAGVAPTTSLTLLELLRRPTMPSWRPSSTQRRRPRHETSPASGPQLLFSGEYDARPRDPVDQRRRRRHRGHRLGRDAPADVPPLGRAASLQDRGRRPARGRAGGPQERDRRDRRPRRLRLAACRARRPSPRPDQPVRLPRSGARPRSRWSRCMPEAETRTSRSSSTGTRSGSTPTARRARAASTSTRPTRRCG